MTEQTHSEEALPENSGRVSKTARELCLLGNPDHQMENLELEISQVLGIDIMSARDYFVKTMNWYVLKKTPEPKDIEPNIVSMIIHMTSTLRIPSMTDRWDYVFPYLREHFPKENTSYTALDYGGGGGKDCIILAKLGFKVVYCDLTDMGGIIDFVKKRFEIRNLDIDTTHVRRLPNRRFDLINCLDVIEHVYDVEEITADIISRTKLNGIFLCCPTFYNDWTGDHIEKNCAYNSFYHLLLVGVGLKLLGTVGGIMVLQKTVTFDEDIDSEKETIRKKLYEYSKKFSKEVVVDSLKDLEVADFHVLAKTENQEFPERFTRIIDALAVLRLSMQRLSKY